VRTVRSSVLALCAFSLALVTCFRTTAEIPYGPSYQTRVPPEDVVEIAFDMVSISREIVAFDIQTRILTHNNTPPSLAYCVSAGNSMVPTPLLEKDVNWGLMYTDGKERWSWSITKRHMTSWSSYGPCNSPLAPILLFPFESFHLELYVSSEKPHLSLIPYASNPSFVVNMSKENLPLNEVPTRIASDEDMKEFFSQPLSGTRYACHVKITVSHAVDYKLIIIGLGAVLFLVAYVLFRVRNETGSSVRKENQQAPLTILLFLPMFLLAYRNSYAPPWTTSIDAGTVIVLLVFGGYFAKNVGGAHTPQDGARSAGNEQTSATAAKTKVEVLPQLIQPLTQWLRKFSFTQKSAVVGIFGAIVIALLAIRVPTLAAFLGALAGFFAAVASTAFFKAHETQADLLNSQRRIIGPLEYRAKALVEDPDMNYDEFVKRFDRFKQLQELGEFGFLSDNVRGIYSDCIDLAKDYGLALKGELKPEVVPNEFGITADNIDAKQVTRAPLSRLVGLLVRHCRSEAGVPQPMRTLRMGTISIKRIGRLILYRKTEMKGAT